MNRLLVCALASLGLFPSLVKAAGFTLERGETGVTVKCDGELFTRYVVKSGAKPILWPIIGPSGKEMTRGYPMREPSEFEKKDHIHHRSFWFDHGDVNGISFWAETSRHGTIEHREYLEMREGESALIRTRNDWVAPDGKKVCEDVRTMTFGSAASGTGEVQRWIDFGVTVTASEGQVLFGDTKEGSFGLRVAGSMRVERKAGGKIVNAEGNTDEDAWGKRSAWVDYSGPVDDQTVGIAILNHPQSLRFPTYWHVRTYGLFAANPFGVHDFLGNPESNGSLALKPGESFSLYYRVILHAGDATAAGIADAYARYAREPVKP